MAEFEYLYTTTATGFFEIEDIGNFAISCTNDIYNEYIMIVKTVYGVSKILQYGPKPIDIDNPNDSMKFTFTKIDFSEYKLESMVNKFINDPKKIISQVTVIEYTDALNRIQDFRRYMYD